MAVENGQEDVLPEIHALLTLEETEANSLPYFSEFQTALICAARGGHHTTVKTLLAAGADVNRVPFSEERSGWTALHAAVGAGKLDIVNMLIDAGADIDCLAYDPHNTQGLISLLQLASREGHTDIVRSLLVAGADVSFDVEIALDDENWELARNLEAAGASIDALTSRKTKIKMLEALQTTGGRNLTHRRKQLDLRSSRIP